MKKIGKFGYAFFIALTLTSSAFSNVYAKSISVIPGGKAVGIKIYTEGLLVVGVDNVKTSSGETLSPALKSGIKINDIILKADNVEVSSAEQLSEILQNKLSEVALTVKRGSKVFETIITPVISDDGKAHIGLWLRDSTAGIGTLTYINPSDMSFAALGHGICDIDTGNILSVKSGNILKCPYLSVIKSKKGSPGEISGSFDKENLGNITKNTQYGIFGTCKNMDFIEATETIPTAERGEVKTGEAYILSDVDGSGVKQYNIEITKISKNADDKAIVFKVTDKSLIEKTGGIVQGMSGSPIIQDGKLAGAVTHVLINSPDKGYGISIENMLFEK